MHFLRSRLRRDLHGIDENELYTRMRVGTKQLVETYIEEVCFALHAVSTVQSPGISDTDKLMFFNETRHAYGR